MLYNFLKKVCHYLLIILAKIEVKNLDKIPSQGPIVLICNHRSLWDPVVLGVVIPRKLHFMAKEELFKIFLVGSIIRKVGTFPVKRGTADRNAIREALKVLKNGDVLCIFPEGTRGKKGQLLDFQPGATLIAHKGNAPLIPIALKGSEKLFPHGFRNKVEINIGEPLYIENMYKGKITSEQLDEISKLVRDRVENLLK